MISKLRFARGLTISAWPRAVVQPQRLLELIGAALALLGFFAVFAMAQEKRSGRGGMPESLTVDLLLVLAIDCSESVNTDEFRLQIDGTARAIVDDEVIAAIRSGPTSRIAVAVLFWADVASQNVAIDWTLIADHGSAWEVSRRIANLQRPFSGSTSLTGAIDASRRLIARSPFQAILRKIDISGDGRNNNGGLPNRARNRALAEGITINGLAVVNEEPFLADYYERFIVTGPGAFVSVANDFWVYEDAIRAKLLREINWPVS